ncbi:UNVERIFIED_CONTAM: hypothetical protein HDU68_007394 [Siphonaria sp. JEL0065]|nr:hypothetical protein HDU68_007394 [Siphonaria sp. JEL0065]
MEIQEALEKLFPIDEAPEDNNFPRWMPGDGPYGPFIVTGLERVKLGLELANCGPLDRVLDLGCGDGRFCTTALSLYGAISAIGVDSDADVIEIASEKAREFARLTSVGPLFNPEKLSYFHGDIRDDHVKHVVLDPSITILVAFLTPEFSVDCKDVLIEHYERGCRIVAVTFDLANIKELVLKPGCNGINGIWVYEKPAIDQEKRKLERKPSQ